MDFRKGEGGQIVVLTALSMTFLLGCMALAIDVGLLFNMKRKLQNAVDAAATSGAIDYMFNASHTTATAAATSALHANGFPSVTPTVNFYPNIVSVYHNNGDYYVQVAASVTDPTFFLGAFQGMVGHTSAAQKSLTIAASAIAGLPGEGNACVIVLDPSDSDTMDLQGSFNVDAGGCGVVVDSTSSTGLQFTGGGGTLTAKYVAVVGPDAGGHTGDSTPAPVYNTAPVNNPFPSLSGQTPSSDCVAGTGPGGAGGNVNSGTSYSGGATLNTLNNITCFSSAVTLTNFTSANPLPSGVLVFENGVTLGGTLYSGSNGTTLDVYSGQLTVNTNTNLALTAPTSAPTSAVPAGIAILQPSTNTQQLQLQTGSSCGTVTGIIYAPMAQLFLNDSGGDHCGGTGFGDASYTTDLIVYQLFDKTATLNISNYNSYLTTTGPLTAVALVE